MSADENLRKAKDMYAAFDRAEIGAIISGLADNVKWGTNTTVESDIPWFGTKNGPAEVAEGFFQAIVDTLDIKLFEGDVPAAVEFGRVAAAPVNTLRQQTHRCQEISVCL